MKMRSSAHSGSDLAWHGTATSKTTFADLGDADVSKVREGNHPFLVVCS
jgi:hypothetical protein